jgi:hypothetical protein
MKILIILATMFVLVYNASGQYYTESWPVPPTAPVIKDPALKDSSITSVPEQKRSVSTNSGASSTSQSNIRRYFSSGALGNPMGNNRRIEKSSGEIYSPPSTEKGKSSGEIYVPFSSERGVYKIPNEKRKRRDYGINVYDYHSPVGEELSLEEMQWVTDQMPYYQFPRKFKSDCVVGMYTSRKYYSSFNYLLSISPSSFMKFQRDAIEEAYKLFVKHLNEYCQKKGWPQVGKVGTTHKIEKKGSKVKEKFDYNSELKYNIAFTSHPIIVDYNTPKSNQITVYIYCDEIELIK